MYVVDVNYSYVLHGSNLKQSLYSISTIKNTVHKLADSVLSHCLFKVIVLIVKEVNENNTTVLDDWDSQVLFASAMCVGRTQHEVYQGLHELHGNKIS